LLRAFFALLLFASGCAAQLRARVTPYPAGTPAAVPWTLNHALLQPVDRRLLFVVELVEGHAPEPEALDHLVALAARYGERPASRVLAGQPGAPPVRWEGERPVVEGPLAPDTTYVFIRYVGEKIHHFGLSTPVFLGDRTVYLIQVNQEAHRPYRPLLPQRRLEEQTLVHEYGHLLGLPPSDHGYYAGYPDFDGGAHCVNPDCPLTLPSPRSVLYGVGNVVVHKRYLDDYCEQCRRAIAAAKAYWRRPQR
jgi:hypothetical protein